MAPGLSWKTLMHMIWAFMKGVADSLTGALDLFWLDSRKIKEKEVSLLNRESQRERLLNRESPARDIEHFAKKRALEKRERERIKTTIHSNFQRDKSQQNEPRILERTMKCCVLNGLVFLFSMQLFDVILLPSIEALLFSSAEEPDKTDNVWSWIRPLLTSIFSACWLLPLYLLTKIVNAIWFQDIANLAFEYNKGRHNAMPSVSVLIADTLITLWVEGIFLVQGKILSWIPIPFIGMLLNNLHCCLLSSLYCFEYKWFNQGHGLARRLQFIEADWPYFLGFGLPLTIVTNMSDSTLISGCFFAILFPLFLVSAYQAHVVTVVEVREHCLNIFKPTMTVSNAILSRTFKDKKLNARSGASQSIKQN